MTAGRRHWTPEEDAYLLAHPDLPQAELARTLGRTTPAISNRRQKLGLRRTKEPRWTREDKEHLRSLWGKVPAAEIARALGRSLNAVLIRAKRLGLGATTLASGAWTARMVAEALGVDIHVVSRWIELVAGNRHAHPMKRAPGTRRNASTRSG